VNLESSTGQPALRFATDPAIVKLLLEHGADRKEERE
jgi:hypothetical protein